VIVDDVATHPFWAKYRQLALPFGLLACWSTPIISAEGELLGTFAMYYRQKRGPTAREIGWVAAATHLSAIAIGRDRTEQSLRRSARCERSWTHAETRVIPSRHPVRDR
jgi:GAF domain-containing protein